MGEKITIQKDERRYRFVFYANECVIRHERLVRGGMVAGSRYVSCREGKKELEERLGEGFLKFQNEKEVSWYATVENNTPYAEIWETRGSYLIPVISRSIEWHAYE